MKEKIVSAVSTQNEVKERPETSAIIVAVASIIVILMSDPVQQVVAGNEFNEGYRYVHMRERDVELYEKSNRYTDCTTR
jgi:hypothetical protein